MKKEIIILAVICLAISLAEIIYINSSPMIGYTEENYIVPKKSILIGSLDLFNKTEEAYERFSPRRNDFTIIKPMAKLMFVGWEILGVLIDVGKTSFVMGLEDRDICVGLLGYKNRSDGLNDCLRELNIGAISSEYLSDDPGVMGRFLPAFPGGVGIRMNGKSALEYKDMVASMPLGWWILVDIMNVWQVWLFEDQIIEHQIESGCISNLENGTCVKQYSLDRDKRRREIADYLGYINYKSTRFETFWGESEDHFKGIMYLSYYPHYKSIFIWTRGLSESDMNSVKVLVEGNEYPFEVIYPIVLVNEVELAEGEHRLEIKLSDKSYLSMFNVVYEIHKDLYETAQ
jgi:hypothetical protein